MNLINETSHSRTYQKNDLIIKYEFNGQRARWDDIMGVEKKKQKPANISEEDFLTKLFDDLSEVQQDQFFYYLTQDFMTMRREEKLSARTYEEDSVLLKNCNEYFGHIKNYNNLEFDDVHNILKKIEEERGVDKRNRVKKKMQQLLDFALTKKQYNVRHNPLKAHPSTKPVPKAEKQEVGYFELELPAGVNNLHHPIKRLIREADNPTDRLLIILLAYTGARINEIRQLTWDDIVQPRNEHAHLKIKNSKIKPSDVGRKDEYRKIDLNDNFLAELLLQKKRLLGDKEMTYKEKVHSETRKADKSEENRWRWILQTPQGYSFSDRGIRNRYLKLWAKVYDKYHNDEQYPFNYPRNPKGYGFHAFRRFYVCNFRHRLGDQFTKVKEEQLQQFIGHTIGSQVTASVYTKFDQDQLVKKRVNTEIDPGFI